MPASAGRLTRTLDPRMRRTENAHHRASRGASAKVVLLVLAAVSIFAAFAFRLLRNGASDLSYIFFVALAGVVAMLLVAPGRFSPGRDRPPWERTRPPTVGPSSGQRDNPPNE